MCCRPDTVFTVLFRTRGAAHVRPERDQDDDGADDRPDDAAEVEHVVVADTKPTVKTR